MHRLKTMWFGTLYLVATLIHGVVSNDGMRRIKSRASGVDVPTWLERNQDGGISAGAIVDIIVAAMSWIVCMCKCFCSDDDNDDDEKEEEANTKSPDAIVIAADEEQHLFDTVRLRSMIQMTLVNITVEEIYTMLKLCETSTATTAPQDIMVKECQSKD